MKLQELFEAALATPAAERSDLLARAAVDAGTRAQLEAMLRVDARLDGQVCATPVRIGEHLAAAWLGTSLRPGDWLGPFRVCEMLGQGGMGLVFRGEREDPKQQVAIKLVRRGELDALYRQRFDLERRALASLDHPYIARLIDASALPDGTPYFVMEYVSGESLDQYCQARQLSVTQSVRLMILICQAVAHAHRQLIVHRDLKPSNILIDGNGLPKLLDFGIAKRLDADSAALAETGTGQRLLSPRYAAPEQFHGAAASVGSDIYALGVLLFEMLSGKPPFDFEGLSFGQVEHCVAQVAAPPPSARATRREAQRQLRGDLDGIVQQCLRKSADERYSSVPQLIEDLEAWLAGLPVRARGGHRWYRIRKFTRRHRVAVAISASALTALAGAAILLWQQNQALRSQRDLAERALSMMQDAFVAADPMRAAGADLTARQILESARRKLEPLATEQPALFATLARTIASVDLSLGRGEQAANLLGQARTAAATAGISDAGAELALLHARALTSARQLPAAQALLDQLHAQGSRDPAWQATQGRLWTRQGEHRRAVAMLERALKGLAGRPPGDELATSTRHALAEARGIAGDAAGELREIDETLAWQRSGLAPDHPQLIVTRMRRLVALYLGNQHQAVVTEARIILDDVHRIYGEEAAEAASVYNTLGQALGKLGQTEEAIDAYRQALNTSRRAVGRDAPGTLRMHFNLAYTLAAAGQDAEASAVYDELLHLAEQRSGGSNAPLAYYRLHASELLLRQSKASDAVAVLTGGDWILGLQSLSADNQTAYGKVLAEACTAAGPGACPDFGKLLGP